MLSRILIPCAVLWLGLYAILPLLPSAEPAPFQYAFTIPAQHLGCLRIDVHSESFGNFEFEQPATVMGYGGGVTLHDISLINSWACGGL